MASAGHIWKISPHSSQGYCKITQQLAMRDFNIELPRASEPACVSDRLAPIHPLLAMCCKGRHPSLAPWAGAVMNIYCSHNSGSHVCHCCSSAESRVQIVANLAFNMADNCFLVLFNNCISFIWKWMEFNAPCFMEQWFCSSKIRY